MVILQCPRTLRQDGDNSFKVACSVTPLWGGTSQKKKSQCVVVVGDDIKLLVGFLEASINLENIFFLKPGRGKAEDALYCAGTLKIAAHIRDNILLLRAFSGCNTTSALFRYEKKKFINVLNSTELQQVVNIFRDENACPYDIDEEEQKVLIALLGERTLKNH
ncbi:hypothetical protein AVEN_175397-1 [Araneus ventricosus]|uniref:Uncharacterized protein n=1 Tax=Araneus ventricosus TaxID=182803 RepID=A0A4Y2HVK4_ARAVE|nr:hypothetical protein AVEN_175397-1 [Araneus ventricosus]